MLADYRPIKPSTTKTAPATINQCVYRISESMLNQAISDRSGLRFRPIYPDFLEFLRTYGGDAYGSPSWAVCRVAQIAMVLSAVCRNVSGEIYREEHGLIS
jgi:hypothetical protein